MAFDGAVFDFALACVAAGFPAAALPRLVVVAAGCVSGVTTPFSCRMSRDFRRAVLLR